MRKVRKVAKGRSAKQGDTQKQGEAQRHEEELQAIKEQDPEFYKFLVEEDQKLLDFTADVEGESEEEGEPEEGTKTPKEEISASPRFLTLERFQQIQSSAKSSMTAFKAVANAFHVAVRSINAEEQKDRDEDDTVERSKRAAARRRRRALTIDSEETFSAILEWGLANFLELLEYHGGAEAKDTTLPLDPTRLPRWKRVRLISQVFWDETLFLLTYAQNAEMQAAVLRTCSSAQALAWLWPFKTLQRKYLKIILQIWTQPKAASASTSASPRLLSFLFLRNAAAMTLLKDGLSLQELLRTVLRAFMGATSSYTWRSLNNVRFMENCILELMRLDDAAAYRVGYMFIRQLALVLRNTSLKPVASASKKGQKTVTQKAKAMPKSKAKAGKSKSKQSKPTTENLVSWPYVRSIFLWTRLVSDVKALKDLAYPLYMVVLGSVKSQSSLNFMPFCLHGLRALNELAEKTQKLVPLSALLLRLLDMNLKAIDKAPKGSQEELGKEEVHIEILLQLPNLKEETLIKLGSYICASFTDHLGLLSRSVAFPELAAPVLLHLRRHSKHCRIEALRRQLKALISFVEESRDQVQRFREQLQDLPPAGQLFVLDTTPLTRQRAQLQKRRVEHEKQCIEAESDVKHVKRQRSKSKL